MTRTETDSLGPLTVAREALYGTQTQRARLNFPISGVSISHLPDLLRALAMVKKAAATTNAALGTLTHDKALIIAQVCDEILAGQHRNQFPVDVFQGGAGTSTNMNMNEVIANRGLELMGHALGDYAHLHPNDDVNQSQSTNDAYPTAVRLALLLATPRLTAALAQLALAFQDRGSAFADIPKLGRTEMQDAVPMLLGQEMAAFAHTIREDIQRLTEAMALISEVNLGGTAIGTGINTAVGYRPMALAELVRLSGVPLTSASNLIEASWDAGAFVHFSGVLKRVAVKLSKISNDLRLLSSGPRGGLGEIWLPAVQPGSSIMPGKVNPVIPEMVNQVAFHVIGTDLTVTMAAEAGQLQLNAFEPLIAYSLLQSVNLLANAAEIFARRCVAGIEADAEACQRHLMASTASATALVPVIGYERAAVLAKRMLETRRPLNDLLLEMKDLEPDVRLALDDHFAQSSAKYSIKFPTPDAD
jgi:aspartate ammonia-lyase